MLVLIRDIEFEGHRVLDAVHHKAVGLGVVHGGVPNIWEIPGVDSKKECHTKTNNDSHQCEREVGEAGCRKSHDKPEAAITIDLPHREVEIDQEECKADQRSNAGGQEDSRNEGNESEGKEVEGEDQVLDEKRSLLAIEQPEDHGEDRRRGNEYDVWRNGDSKAEQFVYVMSGLLPLHLAKGVVDVGSAVAGGLQKGLVEKGAECKEDKQSGQQINSGWNKVALSAAGEVLGRKEAGTKEERGDRPNQFGIKCDDVIQQLFNIVQDGWERRFEDLSTLRAIQASANCAAIRAGAGFAGDGWLSGEVGSGLAGGHRDLNVREVVHSYCKDSELLEAADESGAEEDRVGDGKWEALSSEWNRTADGIDLIANILYETKPLSAPRDVPGSSASGLDRVRGLAGYGGGSVEPKKVMQDEACQKSVILQAQLCSPHCFRRGSIYRFRERAQKLIHDTSI